MTGPDGSPAATTVTEPRWVRILVWAGFPLLGAAAGWALQAAAGPLGDQPGVPKRRIFEFVGDLPDLPRVTGALLLGLIVGLLVAAMAADERLVVTVNPERVTLARGGKPGREFDRATVDVVFPDGKELVLLDRSTAELAREKHDLTVAELRAALVEHGYRWRDADPHEADYRLWVPSVATDLPSGAETLLQVRGRALKKADEAQELRRELARLGVVVRDRKNRQHWRHASPPPAGPAENTDATDGSSDPAGKTGRPAGGGDETGGPGRLG